MTYLILLIRMWESVFQQGGDAVGPIHLDGNVQRRPAVGTVLGRNGQGTWSPFLRCVDGLEQNLKN